MLQLICLVLTLPIWGQIAQADLARLGVLSRYHKGCLANLIMVFLEMGQHWTFLKEYETFKFLQVLTWRTESLFCPLALWGQAKWTAGILLPGCEQQRQKQKHQQQQPGVVTTGSLSLLLPASLLFSFVENTAPWPHGEYGTLTSSPLLRGKKYKSETLSNWVMCSPC